jgi:hypothetical protein
MADRGTLSPDGNYVAYEPLSQWQAIGNVIKADRRSRSGLPNSPIRRLKNCRAKIPTTNARCGSATKFIFSRTETAASVSLFSFDTKSKRVEQVIENKGLDIKYASAGAGTIVYEQFGSIYTLDAGSKNPKKVNIRVAGDFPGVRPRYEKVGGRIANVAFRRPASAPFSKRAAKFFPRPPTKATRAI